MRPCLRPMAVLVTTAASIGLLISGCHNHGATPTWIDPSAAPSPVRLLGEDCLDLHKLPQGWKVAPYSTRWWATFGIPGQVGRPDDVRYNLLMDVGASAHGRSLADYREYADQWTTRVPPKDGRWGRRAEWDVPGFEAYPADDGEIVYVGQGVDAEMECVPQSGWCIVHDGIKRRPVALDISFGYDRRLNPVRFLASGSCS